MGFIGMATTQRVTGQGQIQIEAISFASGSSKLHVRNVGATTVTTDAIYVTDNTAGTTLATDTGTDVSTEVSVGEMKTITYSTADSFTRGHSYTFKVVCTDGTTAVYTTRW
jgi:hypothetical protein